MHIHTARTLGQVESAVFAGEMDLEQATAYMLAHCEIDADDLDTVRGKLRDTMNDRVATESAMSPAS